MLSSAELYPLVRAWLQAMGVAPHATALAALPILVTTLLVGQSLRPSALMRALLSPTPVPARQRYKRVARAWTRRWLSPEWLTPCLVRAALALVAPDPAGTPTAGLTHLVSMANENVADSAGDVSQPCRRNGASGAGE